MELRDKVTEVVPAGNPNKKRFLLVVGALIGLAVIGILLLLVIIVAVLPRGQTTATKVAQATPTLTPAPSTSSTPNPVATAGGAGLAGTPGTIPTITPSTVATPDTKGGTGAVNSSPNPLPGLYVTSMRVNPKPRKNEPITFFVTVNNTTGKSQTHKVCAEIYHPGDQKSFGITSCTTQVIPSGTSEVTTGAWVLTGIHACLPVRARPVVRNEGETRLPLQQPNGSGLWLDLQVCP